MKTTDQQIIELYLIDWGHGMIAITVGVSILKVWSTIATYERYTGTSR